MHSVWSCFGPVMLDWRDDHMRTCFLLTMVINCSSRVFFHISPA